MAFKKKTWVNVPDPSNPPSIPEGQDALARFDAENMNRIEDGVEEALSLTPEDIGAVALHDNVVVGTRTNHSSDGGIRFGIRYTEDGIPVVGMGTQRGSNSLILTSGCDYTNYAKETELGQRGYYFPVQLDESNTSYPVAIKISNQDGKAYIVRASNGRKYYSKNEIIPMSEHELLHTGNASTLVPKAIENLPISKGGTGGTKDSEAANNLKVKSIGGGIEVTQNADLNSYITVGNYVCSQSSVAQTLINCPILRAFIMTVGYAHGGSAYISQEITQFDTGVKYYRFYNATSKVWSDWQSTYGTANKPMPEDIGAANIATGSYVGTGSASVTLTADFDIRLVWIISASYARLETTMVKGDNNISLSSRSINITWGGNTVSWQISENMDKGGGCYNSTGETYNYILIG